MQLAVRRAEPDDRTAGIARRRKCRCVGESCLRRAVPTLRRPATRSGCRRSLRGFPPYAIDLRRVPVPLGSRHLPDTDFPVTTTPLILQPPRRSVLVATLLRLGPLLALAVVFLLFTALRPKQF